MYQVLEKYTMFFTLLTSTVFWYLAIRLAKKEDKKYELIKKEQIISFIISVLSCFFINLINRDVVFISLFFMTGIISILSVSIIIDFKHKELPDYLTLLSFFLSVMYLFVISLGVSLATTRQYLFILLGIVSICVLITFIICYFFGGIGFGDVKLLIPVLLFIPPRYIMSYWVNTIILACIYSLFLYMKTKDKKLTIPFGPFIIMGLLSIFMHVIWF